MTSIRIRPRFKYHSLLSTTEIQERIRASLMHEDRCTVTTRTDYIIIQIKPQYYHYWSPQLTLSLEPSEEGTLVRGLYGPSPSIWLLFTFGYALIGFVAMIVIIIGTSRWSLGMDAPILWLLPLLVGSAIGIYILGQIGQKLGAEQLYIIHHFLENALEERVQVA
jgi:hypothetical protein